jgi:hypothetical protein
MLEAVIRDRASREKSIGFLAYEVGVSAQAILRGLED